MKTINLFGLKLQFEIKRNKYSDENIYSSDYYFNNVHSSFFIKDISYLQSK